MFDWDKFRRYAEEAGKYITDYTKAREAIKFNSMYSDEYKQQQLDKLHESTAANVARNFRIMRDSVDVTADQAERKARATLDAAPFDQRTYYATIAEQALGRMTDAQAIDHYRKTVESGDRTHAAEIGRILDTRISTASDEGVRWPAVRRELRSPEETTIAQAQAGRKVASGFLDQISSHADWMLGTARDSGSAPDAQVLTASMDHAQNATDRAIGAA